jgi:choline dehydrogenase
MAYQRGTVGSYKMMADMVGDDAYEFDRFLPYFEKSLNFTPPDDNIRAANATVDYDDSNLGNGTGPLRATYANYANPMSSWIQAGLEQIGLGRQRGFNSGSLNGSSYALSNIDHSTGTRESSETSFLQWAMRNSDIQVYQSTLAKKVLFDSHNRAIGVSCDSAGHTYTLSARREVIVSAGSFQSPQLLMVSGVGPARTLRKFGIKVISDLRAVGQNMWDHVCKSLPPSNRRLLFLCVTYADLATSNYRCRPQLSRRHTYRFRFGQCHNSSPSRGRVQEQAGRSSI